MSKSRVGSRGLRMRLKAVNRGFTLLELMIVLAIVAIGIALAVPSYEDVLQRRETTSKAESLAAFLAYAQSAAMKRNTEISIQLSRTSDNDWCLGADESLTGCDCTGDDAADLCTIDGVVRTISSATQTRSSMTDAAADVVFAFDPIRGTMITADLGNDHDFTLQSDNGKYELEVQVGVTGRIRVCNSDSSKAVPGFKPCQ